MTSSQQQTNVSRSSKPSIMFGFLFNKKSKSLDKDSGKNGSSSSSSRKSKRSSNNDKSPFAVSDDFLASSNSEKESSDSSTTDLNNHFCQSTSSLPTTTRNLNDFHDDIPFHDDDPEHEPVVQVVEEEKNTDIGDNSGCSGKTGDFRKESQVSESLKEETQDLDKVESEKRDTQDAERNAMMQLQELRSKLLGKETELKLMQTDLNMLTVDRDNKVVEMEGLTSQLMVLQVENESSVEKTQKLETEMEELRSKNNHISQELSKKTEQIKSVEASSQQNDKTVIELQARVRELEAKIKELEVDRDNIEQERVAVESEREEELRAMQNALDDALEAKIKIQTKYEREFEELRTTNSQQEQQLMEDFEWKLRQTEQTCKKKLQEKDKQLEDKVREARLLESKEITVEKEQLRQERRYVEDQMKQVTHLKSYEAEVVQLRGLTHEQQKALRAASRQLEHFKLNDKLLQDEVRSLRVTLEKEKTHAQVLQASNQRRLDAQEENLQSKLDKQKNEINAMWEDRCRAECTRLKEDLGRLHAEEKHLAVETMKIQKEQEMSKQKQSWDRQREQLVQDISKLKDTIQEKESHFHREIEKITTQADRDGWEMRRQLEKLTGAHIEQIDKLKEAQAEEIDRLKQRLQTDQSKVDELEERLLALDVERKELAIEVENLKRSQPPPAPCQSPGIPVEVQTIKVTPLQTQKDDTESETEEEEEEEEEDEEEATEEEEEEEDDEEDEEDDTEESEIVSPVSASKNGIANLRQEVAHLQGSIEKLTSELTNEAAEEQPVLESKSPQPPPPPPATTTSSRLFSGKHGKSSESSESEEEDDEE